MAEKIIELVRSEPCLYDTNHTNYSHKSLKERLWARIAKELKYEDGQAAKDAWQKLRNCHRDAIRRRKKYSKSGYITKAWKYEKQMDFLIPHMSNRPPMTRMSTENSNQTKFIKSEDGNKYHELDFEEDNHDPLFEVSQFGPFSRESSEVAVVPSRNLNALIAKTLSDHEKNASIGEEDDLRHFFNTMYTITKKMPALTQHKLKRRIFNMISDEEENLLQAGSISVENSSTENR